jgi:hypothetical protein
MDILKKIILIKKKLSEFCNLTRHNSWSFNLCDLGHVYKMFQPFRLTKHVVSKNKL